MSIDARQDSETVRRLVDNIIELADEAIEYDTPVDPQQLKEMAERLGELLADLLEGDFGGWSADEEGEFFDGDDMDE